MDPASVTDKDLRSHFGQFGEIKNVHCLAKQSAAFVEFVNRDCTERAVHGSFNKTTINGQRLRVMWGRGQSTQQKSIEDGSPYSYNVSLISLCVSPSPSSVTPLSLPLFDSFYWHSTIPSGVPTPPLKYSNLPSQVLQTPL